MCSKSLDFLPDNRTILDSRNGLIFCCNSDRHFVCNPVDKTYHEISGIDRHLGFNLLDFNPLKSAHYKLVLVEWSALSGALEFNVYHSNKQQFQKELVHVQHLFHLDCIRSNIALWNGYVYLVCGLAADPSKGSVWKVLKISGVLQEGGDRQSISYGFIKFPQRISRCRKGELCSYMDTWRGKLRFVSISAQRIKVWALRNTDEDEWTLEHDCAATFLGLSGNFWDNREKLHIDGFHPTRNVLLIMFKNLLHAYDFDQSSYWNFYQFENDRVLPWTVFSFSPCFAKKVLA